MKHGFSRLENTDGHSKFWEGWVERSGEQWVFRYRYGKIGGYAREGESVFATKHLADKSLNTKILRKLGGGYVFAKRSSFVVEKPTENNAVNTGLPKAAPVPEADPVSDLDFLDFVW